MSKKITYASLVIIALALLPFLLTGKVPPGKIGVRQSLFSGVSDQDFVPGRILDIGFAHTIHLLPAGLHLQEFTGANSLSVRTIERNVIAVDVVVRYEIIPGEAHLLVKESLKDSYDEKVASISQDFLQKKFAVLTNDAIQDPDARVKVANEAIDPLNEQVAQYHVRVVPDGVIIRAIKFPKDYEGKLQQNQLYKMQGKLDTAKKEESQAIQETETVEKGIDKDVKLETETWNGKVQAERTKVEVEITTVNGETSAYDQTRRAEADSVCAKAAAEGNLALAKASALGKKLESDALSSSAGRTYSAVKAAQSFVLSSHLEFNTSDPLFLTKFGSVSAWRNFFLGH